MSWKNKYSSMNAYDIHKSFINEYVLTKKGSTTLLKRDTSRDKTDLDVVHENHQFIWDVSDKIDTWEKKVAKKYYDRLFKEYCVGDLSSYKEDKFGFRWRTEKELIDGKGQFSCGEKRCLERSKLRTWEVNFGYVEHGLKKNALVKLRLCPKCSKKLNYRFRRKESKRLQPSDNEPKATSSTDLSEGTELHNPQISSEKTASSTMWQPQTSDTSTNDDKEIDDFLQDLFL